MAPPGGDEVINIHQPSQRAPRPGLLLQYLQGRQEGAEVQQLQGKKEIIREKRYVGPMLNCPIVKYLRMVLT